ncbi:MAG TPA: ABC transporter substrate-binding protein [Caldilineae bacterium]|nr:ABC transporter substrate-binding protein [Caldilineae bacterium]
MRRIWTVALIASLVLLSVPWIPAFAQEGTTPQLLIFTRYPSQTAEVGETINLSLTLRSSNLPPQIVRLDMAEVPEGWTAVFRGGGRVVKSAFVQPDQDVSVSLRLQPPEDVSPGTYRFVAVARGKGVEARLPIELIVQEKLPPKLSLEVELPVLRGSPTTTFRFEGKLKNEGDEDMTVNLEAEAPEGFQVTFKSSYGTQEVTSLPLKANESKRLTIEVRAPRGTPAGEYPIIVTARGSEAQTRVELTAQVTGRPSLSVTAPDARLSGEAYAGKESPLTIVVRNTGSAPARNVSMSATKPSGWSIEFDPKEIDEIPAGDQAEVTAKIRPAAKAVAGDYMVTIRASAEGGTSDSTDFRITVLTSTLWGVVGIALIAVAVGVVALAVLRFGRR